MPAPREPTALGVHVYAGGFTLGMRRRFRVLAHLEDGTFGVETFSANFPGIPVFTSRSEWPLDELRGRVDVVYGNPPCAPFSSVGSRGRWEGDARVQGLLDLVDVGMAVRPRAWVWESVCQAYTAGRRLAEQATARFMELGYAVTHLFTNAVLHGVPQSRERYHCIAHDFRIPWRQPAEPVVTVREALEGVAPDSWASLPSALTPLLPYVLPGCAAPRVFEWLMGYRRHVRGPVAGRPAQVLRRARWDTPAHTIVGGPCVLHPDEDRLLSPAEHSALCGYPRDYVWTGSLTERYRQVGRSVTPGVAAYLAEMLRMGLEENETAPQEASVVDFRPLAAPVRAAMRPPRLPVEWRGMWVAESPVEHAGRARASYG